MKIKKLPPCSINVEYANTPVIETYVYDGSNLMKVVQLVVCNGEGSESVIRYVADSTWGYREVILHKDIERFCFFPTPGHSIPEDHFVSLVAEYSVWGFDDFMPGCKAWGIDTVSMEDGTTEPIEQFLDELKKYNNI